MVPAATTVPLAADTPDNTAVLRPASVTLPVTAAATGIAAIDEMATTGPATARIGHATDHEVYGPPDARTSSWNHSPGTRRSNMPLGATASYSSGPTWLSEMYSGIWVALVTE